MAYAPDALFDAFFFRVGKAEAELLLTSSVDMKGFADNESYVLSGGFT